jgi:hypothetical protein
MKTIYSKIFTSLLIPLLAGPVVANGQGFTTGVVGAVNVDVPTGPTVVSFPFLQSLVLQADVGAKAGNDLTFADPIPTLDGPHFVHVRTGTDTGRIYAIDSYVGSTLTLVNEPAGVEAGDSVAIRPYTTLADLGTPPPLTTVTLLNEGGDPLVASANFGGNWNVTAEDVVINPGEGMVINNNTIWSITMMGAVSEDDVIFEAASGPQIIGNIDPVNGSSDVLNTIAANAPNLTTLTELGAGGSPTVYSKNFLGNWNFDPSNIDVSNLKSFIMNTNGIDVVNAGIVIGD